MKQQFSDTGQQAVKGWSQKERKKTKKINSIIAPAYCLKAVYRLQQESNENPFLWTITLNVNGVNTNSKSNTVRLDLKSKKTICYL